MKPAPFDYAAPDSLEEALTLLADYGEDARPLAGGQSLVPMLALRLARPSALIDLNRIAALSGIAVEGAALRIGAMTRQAALLASGEVARHAPLLRQALQLVGHPPTRARGTIGGSLSHADPAAELPAALLTLDAEIVIQGPAGERRVPAAEFCFGPFETAVQPGEILTEVRIPLHGPSGSAFLEISPREGDFAVVSAAVRLNLDENGLCREAAVVLGAVAPTPLRCANSEAVLHGRGLDSKTIAEAVAALPVDAVEFDSPFAGRDYRRRMAGVLVRRAIEAALQLQGEAA
ncbi:MAG: xanthine dehydrogenase family protein subunit M [Rhodovibrionaceae bacterium]